MLGLSLDELSEAALAASREATTRLDKPAFEFCRLLAGAANIRVGTGMLN